MRQIEGVERGVNHLFLRRRRTLFRNTTKPKRRPQKKPLQTTQRDGRDLKSKILQDLWTQQKRFVKKQTQKSQKPSDESVSPSLLRVGFSFSCALPMNTYLSA
jgi:hypothetical protein